MVDAVHKVLASDPRAAALCAIGQLLMCASERASAPDRRADSTVSDLRLLEALGIAIDLAERNGLTEIVEAMRGAFEKHKRELRL
jgi:hypothetical protein